MRKTPTYCLLLISWFFVLGSTHAQNINTIAGSGTAGYCGDGGVATNACFGNQWGITLDRKGNLYIADRGDNRIRKVNTAGIITTFAGTGVAGYNGDGILATNAMLNYCPGVKTDKIGNVYIADNQNFRVRKIDTTGIITTVIGNGSSGYSGDGGQSTDAKIGGCTDIGIDSCGNIYISDNVNFRIRKINSSGIINTVGGTGIAGFSGDGGQATDAQMNNTNEIAADKFGNIYFFDEDAGGTYSRIRKISVSGIISTIAGVNSLGFSGDGGYATAAQISSAPGIIIDNMGNIFFTDAGNQRIRMISTNGIITTVAGNGTAGFSGDGGTALDAELNVPLGIALDSARNLYISDANNNRIRKLDSTLSMGIKQYMGNSMQLNVYPSPFSNNITIENRNQVLLTKIRIYDLLGMEIITLNPKQMETITYIDTQSFDKGVYFLMAYSNNNSYAIKLIKE